MLCSNSSSTHGPGTTASRAARRRASSSDPLPLATAAATRTRALVRASSTSEATVARCSLIVPPAARCSRILSFLQSSIYAQLTDRFSPCVQIRPRAERRGEGPEPERLEHRSDGQCGSERVTIGDLQGDAESLSHERRAVDALRPDLGDDPTWMGPHELRTGPSLARNQLGVVEHGGGDRCRPLPSPAAPEFSIRQRHIAKRDREAHHAAAVHTRPNRRLRNLRPSAHLGEAAWPDRVLRPGVELRRPVVVAREREHAGVLPRAIRIDRSEPYASRLVILRDPLGERRMGAAQEVALGAADLRQELADLAHLPGLARVRRTGEGQLFAGQAEPIRYAVLNERHCLKGLRGGTPEGGKLWIARARDDPTRSIHDGDVHLVPGFHHPAAELFNAHGVHPLPPPPTSGERGAVPSVALERTAPCSLVPVTARSPEEQQQRRSRSPARAPHGWQAPARRSGSLPPARRGPPRLRWSRGSVAGRSSSRYGR